MRVPTDDDLQLELAALSSTLYDCLSLAGVLGPTYKEYDRMRDKTWCPSKSLLGIFGETANKAGWNHLLNAYGFIHPTLSQVQQAAYRRKESRRGTHISVEDETYPELVGTWREEVYDIPLPDGNVQRTTRRILSIR